MIHLRGKERWQIVIHMDHRNYYYEMMSVHCSWEQNPEPEKHIGALKLRHSLRLFGFNLSLLDMDVVAKQVKLYMFFCWINNKITMHGVL